MAYITVPEQGSNEVVLQGDAGLVYVPPGQMAGVGATGMAGFAGWGGMGIVNESPSQFARAAAQRAANPVPMIRPRMIHTAGLGSPKGCLGCPQSPLGRGAALSALGVEESEGLREEVKARWERMQDYSAWMSGLGQDPSSPSAPPIILSSENLSLDQALPSPTAATPSRAALAPKAGAAAPVPVPAWSAVRPSPTFLVNPQVLLHPAPERKVIRRVEDASGGAEDMSTVTTPPMTGKKMALIGLLALSGLYIASRG